MKKHLILVFLFASALSGSLHAQINSDSLGELITGRSFNSYKTKSVPQRKFLSLKGKSLAARINPVNYAAGAALFVYQRVFSEQIQAHCCYQTSCSSFAKASIEHFGFVKGLLIGLHQFNNCFGGVYNDYPRFKLDATFHIINLPESTE